MSDMTLPRQLLVLSGFGAPFPDTVKRLDAVAAGNPTAFPHLNSFLDRVASIVDEENRRLSRGQPDGVLGEDLLPEEVRSGHGPHGLLALAGLSMRFPCKATKTSTATPGLPVMVAVGVAHAVAEVGTLLWHCERTPPPPSEQRQEPLLTRLGFWAVTGFCGGYVPAYAAAAARTIEDLVEHGLGAVRVGFWVGAAGEAARRRGLLARDEGLGGQQAPPNLKGWGCVVGDLPSEKTEQAVAEFNKRTSVTEPRWASDLFVSARMEPSCVMVTGTPDQLDTFVQEQQAIGDKRRVTRLHIPGPFHSTYFHRDTLPAALAALQAPGSAALPDAAHIVTPLVHTIDGSLAAEHSRLGQDADAAQDMLRVCLQDRADWPRVAASLPALVGAGAKLHICSIGPNPGAARQLAGMVNASLAGAVGFTDLSAPLSV